MKHDITITDPTTSGNPVVGFNLLRTKNVPFWKELNGSSFAELMSFDQQSQYSTDPEKKLILGQSDWRSGFGLEFQDLNDTRRYFASTGMDLRFRGQAIAGWNSTALTVPTFPTLTDSGLEIWTDAATLTNWTYGEDDANFTLAREATIIDTGTYSARIKSNTAVGEPAIGESAYIYQDTSNWAVGLRGLSITVTVRVYNLNIANLKGQLIIDDGIGTTTANSVGTGAWETVTCTRKLDAAATRLRIKLNAIVTNAADSYTFFDTNVVPVIGATVCKEEFDSDLFFSRGQTLCRLNYSTGAVTYQGAFLSTIKDIKKFSVAGTTYLFICFGSSAYYQYMTTGEVFTESNAVVKNFDKFCFVATTTDTLYGQESGSNVNIRSTTNPLNAGVAWSAATVVGDTTNTITSLRDYHGALLIDKSDMPYYLDSTGAVQNDLAPECASANSTHSGKNSVFYQGEYFRPTGAQALLIVGTSNEWVQPSKFTTNNSSYSGQVEACDGDEEWLYVALDNGTLVEIMCTREEEIDGSVRRVWHPIHTLTLTGVETMWISSIYQKRLYITSTLTADSIYYLPLPTKYGDIINDTNASFKTGTSFETSWLTGGFPSDDKAGIKLTVTMGHTYDANIYFNVNYKKLGDSDWSTTTLKFDGSASSMVETNFLEVAGTQRTSTMWKLKFTAVTNSTAKTPILLDYKLSTVMNPVPNLICFTKLKVDRGTPNGDGVYTNSDYNLRKTCLENIRNYTGYVTMTDIDGTTRYVKLLPIQSTEYPFREILRDESDTVIAYIYNLFLMNIPLS